MCTLTPFLSLKYIRFLDLEISLVLFLSELQAKARQPKTFMLDIGKFGLA